MDRCNFKITSCHVIIVLFTVFFFVVGGDSSDNNPILSIESTVVKAYNLTADNSLFWIISLGFRAKNPSQYSFGISNLETEVKKGKHHGLANDALLDFSLGPGETVATVEAVGLRVVVGKKIARELRADALAGEGRVNVLMTGSWGPDDVRVACENVAVDFSRSTAKIQWVDCKVSITAPPPPPPDTSVGAPTGESAVPTEPYSVELP